MREPLLQIESNKQFDIVFEVAKQSRIINRESEELKKEPLC